MSQASTSGHSHSNCVRDGQFAVKRCVHQLDGYTRALQAGSHAQALVQLPGQNAFDQAERIESRAVGNGACDIIHRNVPAAANQQLTAVSSAGAFLWSVPIGYGAIVLAVADSPAVAREWKFREGSNYVRMVPTQPTVGGAD